MNRERLSTPVLALIAIVSILVLLYVSLYVLSQKRTEYKKAEGGEYEYAPGFTVPSRPVQETDEFARETSVRRSTQSDLEKLNQDTTQELQHLRRERDLQKNQPYLP